MSTPVLSLNQATTRGFGLIETAEAAAAVGITQIGLWTDPVEEIGLARTQKLLADTGLGVSSVCRIGFVADKRGAALQAALDEVKAAIELSAAVGSPMLTFIAGGLPEADRSIANAEARVTEALATLVPYAQDAGIRLALEPLHPLFVGDRSMVTTVAQAHRVVRDLPSDAVGILIDAYATWWDPDLAESLALAGDRIAGFQVNDFALPLPLPENMNGRLFPGDGVIDLPAMVDAVLAAGYTGAIEVEIFNDEIWAMPLQRIVERTIESYNKHVIGHFALQGADK